MSTRPRMSITDILHRGLLYTLVGITVWGVVMIGVVHRDTLKRGRVERHYPEALALQEADVQKDKEAEDNEIALAQAAQAALEKTGKSW
ncbi:hypothetical protein FOMPIDRAFT_82593 [Fomitopsis schrenkii]|uniref:Uncharacterized protein n=1 Tax=Fomitopsis schrenkii TaxID=2126942 RepID=S8FVZ4_FOMSC|nr:hypothetical protein FOMPIDRAFT_82593 [Fomitopsis schrenkii]